jgi:hypothetical protein
MARREFERMQAQMAGHDPDIATAVADADADAPAALPDPEHAAASPSEDTPQGDRDGRG